MGGKRANEPADLGLLSPPTEKSAGAAFDFLRPILVVVRLPQIERGKRGDHTHSKRRRRRRRGDNPRKV